MVVVASGKRKECLSCVAANCRSKQTRQPQRDHGQDQPTMGARHITISQCRIQSWMEDATGPGIAVLDNAMGGFTNGEVTAKYIAKLNNTQKKAKSLHLFANVVPFSVKQPTTAPLIGMRHIQRSQ